MKTFWTCWVDDSNGGYGYRHASLDAAKAEADRLARLASNQGKMVIVLQALGYAEIPRPDTWHLCEFNEIPF